MTEKPEQKRVEFRGRRVADHYPERHAYAQTITDKQIGQLGTIAGLPDEIRHACYCALNNYALSPHSLQEARQACANALNRAKRNAWQASLKTAEAA